MEENRVITQTHNVQCSVCDMIALASDLLGADLSSILHQRSCDYYKSNFKTLIQIHDIQVI